MLIGFPHAAMQTLDFPWVAPRSLEACRRVMVGICVYVCVSSVPLNLFSFTSPAPECLNEE